MALVVVMATALAGADLVRAGDLPSDVPNDIVITPAGAEVTAKEKQAEGWGAGSKRVVKKWASALGKVTRHVFGVFGGDKPPEKKSPPSNSSSLKQTTVVTGTPVEGDQTKMDEKLPTVVSTEPGSTQNNVKVEGSFARGEMQTALGAPAATSKLEGKHNSASCKKAKATISKYAFTDIEAKTCEGEVLQFAAFRNGEKFSIDVHAGSGDLIKVEKLAPNAASIEIEEHPRPY
jgi:hypothetical protein